MDDPVLRAVVGLALVATAAVVLWQSFTDRRLFRLIVDTPTSQARGVFVGFNEVVGTAQAERPLRTRFTRQDCVWHDYAERQQIKRRDRESGKASTSWINAGSDRRAVIFEVADHTGSVRVNPSGARITGDRIVKGRFRDTSSGVSYPGAAWGGEGATGLFERREEAILVGSKVYVLGAAHLDDDGTRAEIRAEKGVPLLITSRSETELISTLRLRSGAMLAVAAIAAAAGTCLLLGADSLAAAVPAAMLGAGAVLVAHTVHTFLLLYNNLVRLREREARAWSLIHVQLDRRAELIPQLATCVRTYVELEQTTQVELATQRAGSGSGDSGEVPDDAIIDEASRVAAAQDAAAHQLIALAEAYPDLQADELFRYLHDQLVDTENRIAAARGFFNDSVTALRDQTKRFPSSLIARWSGIAASHQFAVDPRGAAV